MVRATDEAAYLEQVCRIIVDDCGHPMVWIGFAERDPDKTVRPVAYAGFDRGYLETLRLTWADTERGRGPTGTAIRTGKVSACTNMRTDPRFSPWRAEAIARGYASSIVFPLMAEGSAFGALTIYSAEPDPFSEDEQAFLSQLADDLALGISMIRQRLARRRAEQALRHSEERFRALVQLSPEAIFVNRRNRIEFLNPAALTLFGATEAGQLIGQSPFDVFHPDCHEGIRGRLRTLLEGHPVPLIEERIVRLDGSTRDVEVAASPFDDADGRAIQVILRDVTERKVAEESLRLSEQRSRALAESLREADGNKNEFLAVLSHELRNPLAPIRNSLYILGRLSPRGAQARRAEAVIERQVGHLSRLVEDLLDVTRISRKKVRIEPQPMDLVELVSRAAEDQRSVFEHAGVELVVEVPRQAVRVSVDPTRIAQVVGNVLQNAAKFTSRGGTARLSLSADETTRQATIAVTDSGAGMSKEMLDRLFQPFMQADRTLDRSKGGLGLGLALTKGIVDLHGGEILATSGGLGKGSQFIVRLPLDASPPSEPQADRPPLTSGHRRVLIIEDNIDAAESLRDALALGGHDVAVAYNGPDGLAKARGFRPELVLCDIGLPVMDGYEVARAFRSDGTLGPAYPASEDLLRAKEAGFDRHLAKPPDPEMLEAMITDLPVGNHGSPRH